MIKKIIVFTSFIKHLSTSQKVFVLQIHRFLGFCRNRLSGKMIFSHFSQYLSDF
nr:MAG TPA: protein of unknown function DUF1244 [Inoviridae sp.]